MTQILTPSSHRPKVDVSHLPSVAFDWRSPLWWGNTLLILIETTTLVLLLVSYFYIARNYREFPPPKVDVIPVVYDTSPDLLWGTLNLVLIIGSSAFMHWIDIRARRLDRRAVAWGLAVMVGVAVLSCLFRWFEFKAVKFWWNDNAYASVVWTILGLHLTYLIAGALEFMVMGAWIATHELDEKHALDVTLAGGYWFWLAANWFVIYGVIYLAPRLI